MANNLFDLITGKIKNVARSRTQANPQIHVDLLSEDGGVDIPATMAMEHATKPWSLRDGAFGSTVTRDIQKYDPATKKMELETISSYKPGFLNDITSGYKENRFTPVSMNNFNQNTLNDGRKKGFAYKLGEGLGSIARFGESPLGRSLIVGGLVGATGGNPLEMMAYGAQTGALNQGNRMRDRVYRDDLINARKTLLINNPNWSKISQEEKNEILGNISSQEDFNSLSKEKRDELYKNAEAEYLKNRQQGQLEDIENNINSYRGYLDNNSYNNMIRAQELRDNAEWKRLYFDTQQQNIETQREWQRQQAEQQRADRQAEFDYRKYNDAQNRGLQKRGQDLNYELGNARINADKNQSRQQRIMPAGSAADLSATYQGLIQMHELENKIPQLPRRLTTPGIAQLSALNPLDKDAQAFNQYVKTYKQVIGKGLEGGVLRKEDEYKYDQIIPKVGDTQEVLMKKTEQLQAMLLNKYYSDSEFLEKAGYDTSAISTIRVPNQINPNIRPQNQDLNINQNALEAEMKRRGLK